MKIVIKICVFLIKLNNYKMEITNFDNCDGKECGEGKYAGFGKWVCVHNNLGIRFPSLIEEWWPQNNKTIYDYLPNSNEKII